MSNKEIICTDDIHFVTEKVPNFTSITNTMHIFNLKVNTNKTEITIPSPTNLDTIATKKLGTHLSMAIALSQQCNIFEEQAGNGFCLLILL